MKRLYLEEAKSSTDSPDDVGQETSKDYYQEKMRQKINNGSEFSMSYLNLLAIKFLQNMCCCIVNRYDKEEFKDGWYRRNVQRLRRLELAKAKLRSELELDLFVSMNRLAHFLNKVVLNRRQRVSVQYFQRYLVKDS